MSDLDCTNFTWDQLLEYNISYYKGDLKESFYNVGPVEETPEGIIELHKAGIFVPTICDAVKQKREFSEFRSMYVDHYGRSYMDAFVPLALAKKIMEKAKQDKDVIFELCSISSEKTLYVSDEIKQAVESNRSIHLTRFRDAYSEEELEDLPFKPSETYRNLIDCMDPLYLVDFKHRKSWIDSGLCGLFICDKEFHQTSKSMAKRVLEYLAE